MRFRYLRIDIDTIYIVGIYLSTDVYLCVEIVLLIQTYICFYVKIYKDLYVYVHMYIYIYILQCTKVVSPNKKKHSSHLTNKSLGPRFGCIGTTLSGPMCANFQALIPAAVTTVNRDDGSIIFLGHGISVSGQISLNPFHIARNCDIGARAAACVRSRTTLGQLACLQKNILA